eukprot:COSAG01_NODE_983_length_12354_cov_2.780335_5_plen_100_part_00
MAHRLAAAKARLERAQNRARTDRFGDAARGYDAYKGAKIVPGYMLWADTGALGFWLASAPTCSGWRWVSQQMGRLPSLKLLTKQALLLHDLRVGAAVRA